MFALLLALLLLRLCVCEKERKRNTEAGIGRGILDEGLWARVLGCANVGQIVIFYA
jgi:hypothetical protein